jgi:hypothetical protein
MPGDWMQVAGIFLLASQRLDQIRRVRCGKAARLDQNLERRIEHGAIAPAAVAARWYSGTDRSCRPARVKTTPMVSSV